MRQRPVAEVRPETGSPAWPRAAAGQGLDGPPVAHPQGPFRAPGDFRFSEAKAAERDRTAGTLPGGDGVKGEAQSRRMNPTRYIWLQSGTSTELPRHRPL
ncbi:MAG: hypothetical protein ACM362_06975, partial [Candidatus Methylomirabilota bacterium]